MPLFRRESGEEREARQGAEAEQAASVEALARGGLPLKAQRRLAEFSAKGGSFTSDLSINEFALGVRAGLRPLSQVMGSSVYHVGWQSTPGTWTSGWQSSAISQELGNLSDAWNRARRLAFGRLEQEARMVDAHAVVGVRVTHSSYDWAAHTIEYVAVGTAARIQGAAPAERVALTDLSGQDFWKLRRAGYETLGVVGASTVYYIVPGRATRQAQTGWRASRINQELGDFTRGVYEAREVALGRLTEEAEALGAAGVVGVSVEQSEQEHEIDNDDRASRTDLIVTFHVLGTAIAERGERGAELVVTPTLELRPLTRPGANR
jgi:uncharacterized protein YbjQ (UPF0145 family)